MCFTLGIKTTKMSTVGVAIRPQQTVMSFKTMSSLSKIYAVIQPTHTKKQEKAPQEKSRPLNSEQKIENSTWKLYRAATEDKTAKADVLPEFYKIECGDGSGSTLWM
jgi:hypothetical protein